MPVTALKPFVFALCLIPLGLLVINVAFNRLGPDPAQAITLITGLWALRFILITLSMSPLRQFTGSSNWLKLRRMLGLYAFFYVCLHLLAFQVFILELRFDELTREILERPYIMVGFLAFLLMIPLAVTSTDAMIRRLRKRWQLLHRLVYAIAILAAIHFLWQVRSDYSRQVFYVVWLGLLLGWRLRRYWQRSKVSKK